MRFVIENILLFLLPAAVYLTYKLLRERIPSGRARCRS